MRQEGLAFENEKRETYEGTIQVGFEMPLTQLTSIKFDPKAGWLERVAVATLKRNFTLAADWEVTFCKIKSPVELNGIVRIPRQYQGRLLDYDGASVPLPWLVSFLSMGTLRPLGVMLVPSIVHDFAFRFGELLVAAEPGEAPKAVKIERQDADRLFYDMIRSINGDVLTATLAWLAVRIGWVFVKYNGKRWSGQPPVGAFFTLAILLGLIALLVMKVGAAAAITWITNIALVSYVSVWIGTTLVRKSTGTSDSNKTA